MDNAMLKRYKRKQRKKHGLCPECGKPLDDPRKALCSRCREVTKARVMRFRHKDNS